MGMAQPQARTLIAAHRGGAGLWPENSPTAFRGALTLAVDQIETDVHLSSDGEPFILHDALLDRTTEASGEAARLDWKALSKVRLKGTVHDTIPHLDFILELLRPTAIDLRLELKCDARSEIQPGLAKRALASLDRFAMTRRTTITSFDRRYFGGPVAAADLAGRLWLISRPVMNASTFKDLLAAAKPEGLPEVALHSSQFSPLHHEEAHRTGMRLGYYAVNDAEAMKAAFRHGASAFTTDHPDVAVRVREQGQAQARVRGGDTRHRRQ